MNAFILVWILMGMDTHGGFTYSPPVQTLEDCQRMQSTYYEFGFISSKAKCVQVNVLRRTK